jgi:hypothetical protein
LGDCRREGALKVHEAQSRREIRNPARHPGVPEEDGTREPAMDQRSDKRTDDERNRQAPRLNATSGIRTGNPQLDPDRARKSEDGGAGEEKKRHRPGD